MSAISQSISISAPVGKVFDFVTNPENWTRYVTSLVAVNDLSAGVPVAGTTFSWDYKMMGVKISGTGEVTEYQKNRSFGLSMRSKVRIEERYDFIPDGDSGTTLKIMVEYEMPGEMMKVISNTKLVEKLNAMESRNVLAKIKAMCEA